MIALLLAVIYLSFISLGLPDSLLGSAWPVMYGQFGVPVSFMGIISFIICVGTIVSSLLSDFLTKRLGTGLVTAISVLMTAGALLGFSFSSQFWMLILFAIPYGLGAGGVDASLNNYVALHFKSRHMSWLHCMWGVGASVSPYIMGYALSGGKGWNFGYLIISLIQFALTFVIFISLPLWGKNKKEGKGKVNARALTPRQIIKISGAVPCFITFFAYCSLEQTTMLWASSYMVFSDGISAEMAASFASMFFIGITAGRAVNGFLTFKLSDKTLIRSGLAIIAAGLVFVALPVGEIFTLIGLIIIGLGCAPIYPCIIHMTPSLFGESNSQAIIGVQMASAYLGSCAAPPLFGLVAQYVSVSLFPAYLVVFWILMTVMHEITVFKTKKNTAVTLEK